MGLSGNDCILYDYRAGCEIVRADTKGGARGMACSETTIAWAYTDFINVKVGQKEFVQI
jgi:hypothetical protein